MAKKKQNSYYVKQHAEQKNAKKPYKSPAQQMWGKVIIAILAILMALGGLISVIYLIVQNILH